MDAVLRIRCYVILGLALSISALRRPPALLAMFAGTAAVHVADVVAGIPMPATIGIGAGLATYFFGGAALFAYSDRIRVSAVLAGGCTAVLALAALAEHARPVSALPLAYLMLWLGIVLPFARVGRRNDVSYGVYIYAFPVQQLLVLAGAHELGVGPYIALAFVCTAPLAAASWFLVEKPAMELKRVTPAALLPRRRAVAEPVDIAAETTPAS